MRDTINAWSRLQYHDPEKVLIALREIEEVLTADGIDSDVNQLRTNRLKSERIARDGALLCYGLGLRVLKTKLYMARAESSDHDFVTCWKDGDDTNYCAVQLKELPPAHRNPHINFDSLRKSLKKYSFTETILAVKINREGPFTFPAITRDEIAFKELWFFGATNPRQDEWFLYGDASTNPQLFQFTYPR